MKYSLRTVCPELRVFLLAARPELRHDHIIELRSVITAGIDWNLLVKFVTHHRLVPLLYINLKKACCDLVPDPIFSQIKKLYEASVRTSLAQEVALKRIIAAFSCAGVDLAILKGRALAESLYDDFSRRQSRDVDMLVRQSDALKADAVLRGLGYEMARASGNFKLDSSAGRRFICGRSELDYISSTGQVCVDLHWHLAHSRHAFPVDMDKIWGEMKANRRAADVVYELPVSSHFIFLCYHGSKHHWLRFHWLMDIALLINKGGLDWGAIVNESRSLGVLPSIGLAIFLSHVLFDTAIPPILQTEKGLLLKSERLANTMLENMTRVPDEIEKVVMPLIDFRRVFLGWQLQTNWRHRFITWTDLLFPDEADYQSVRLPLFLSWLYFVVRPVRILHKFVKRSLAIMLWRSPALKDESR